MALRVASVRNGYAVFDGDRQETKEVRLRALAEAALDRMIRAREARARPCLRCGVEIQSSHAGHRMCERCREWVAAQDHRMAL